MTNTNDLQIPPHGPFPDDQDPDKPFYVNKTLATMSRIKSEYRGGRWLYAKNKTDEEIREFYKAPPDAPVEREGDTAAVWVSAKDKEDKEPKFAAFHTEEELNPEAVAEAYRKREERAALELARAPVPPSKAETEPAPPSALSAPLPAPLPVPIAPFIPSRDIEGTLRTCSMKLFELIENVQGTHKDEAHKMLILSNELHAMASRFELGRLRSGAKKR